ncbi:putative glutathione s-transferase [Rosellinia necatrix]|uniref:Putative glutathione s-transferase n=1 Tax=Rosellinia necatrix TaxID=77044 RepID=A0A1W2TQS2_ROSNE|nr:putative glutathione s-transferase [Rosellinia necatrix]
MASFVFEIPREYGYVLAVATSTLFINTYHKFLSAAARRASGIQYPTPYATQEQADRDPKAFRFNLAQRAHANYGENLTPFLAGLLVAGLRYPGPAYYAGAAWVVGRFAYAYAYVNFGPKGRLPGYVVSQLGKLAVTVLAVMTSYHMIQEA